jgi:nitrogenase molybdenum-cofactor synthesis protein NifE
MEPAAKLLKSLYKTTPYIFESIAGLADSDRFMETLSRISGNAVPSSIERQRQILVDGMRDAHGIYGGRRICLALEPDLAVQTSRWLDEMGASVDLAIIPTLSDAADYIKTVEVRIGDLHSLSGEYDALIANSHAERTAKRLNIPLYEMGFPVYKIFGYTSKVTIGYQGTLTLINEMANALMKRH